MNDRGSPAASSSAPIRQREHSEGSTSTSGQVSQSASLGLDAHRRLRGDTGQVDFPVRTPSVSSWDGTSQTARGEREGERTGSRPSKRLSSLARHPPAHHVGQEVGIQDDGGPRQEAEKDKERERSRKRSSRHADGRERERDKERKKKSSLLTSEFGLDILGGGSISGSGSTAGLSSSQNNEPLRDLLASVDIRDALRLIHVDSSQPGSLIPERPAAVPIWSSSHTKRTPSGSSAGVTTNALERTWNDRHDRARTTSTPVATPHTNGTSTTSRNGSFYGTHSVSTTDERPQSRQSSSAYHASSSGAKGGDSPGALAKELGSSRSDDGEGTQDAKKAKEKGLGFVRFKSLRRKESEKRESRKDKGKERQKEPLAEPMEESENENEDDFEEKVRSFASSASSSTLNRTRMAKDFFTARYDPVFAALAEGCPPPSLLAVSRWRKRLERADKRRKRMERAKMGTAREKERRSVGPSNNRVGIPFVTGVAAGAEERLDEQRLRQVSSRGSTLASRTDGGGSSRRSSVNYGSMNPVGFTARDTAMATSSRASSSVGLSDMDKALPVTRADDEAYLARLTGVSPGSTISDKLNANSVIDPSSVALIGGANSLDKGSMPPETAALSMSTSMPASGLLGALRAPVRRTMASFPSIGAAAQLDGHHKLCDWMVSPGDLAVYLACRGKVDAEEGEEVMGGSSSWRGSDAGSLRGSGFAEAGLLPPVEVVDGPARLPSTELLHKSHSRYSSPSSIAVSARSADVLSSGQPPSSRHDSNLSFGFGGDGIEPNRTSAGPQGRRSTFGSVDAPVERLTSPPGMRGISDVSKVEASSALSSCLPSSSSSPYGRPRANSAAPAPTSPSPLSNTFRSPGQTRVKTLSAREQGEGVARRMSDVGTRPNQVRGPYEAAQGSSAFAGLSSEWLPLNIRNSLVQKLKRGGRGPVSLLSGQHWGDQREDGVGGGHATAADMTSERSWSEGEGRTSIASGLGLGLGLGAAVLAGGQQQDHPRTSTSSSRSRRAWERTLRRGVRTSSPELRRKLLSPSSAPEENSDVAAIGETLRLPDGDEEHSSSLPLDDDQLRKRRVSRRSLHRRAQSQKYRSSDILGQEIYNGRVAGAGGHRRGASQWPSAIFQRRDVGLSIDSPEPPSAPHLSSSRESIDEGRAQENLLKAIRGQRSGSDGASESVDGWAEVAHTIRTYEAQIRDLQAYMVKADNSISTSTDKTRGYCLSLTELEQSTKAQTGVQLVYKVPDLRCFSDQSHPPSRDYSAVASAPLDDRSERTDPRELKKLGRSPSAIASAWEATDSLKPLPSETTAAGAAVGRISTQSPRSSRATYRRRHAHDPHWADPIAAVTDAIQRSNKLRDETVGMSREVYELQEQVAQDIRKAVVRVDEIQRAINSTHFQEVRTLEDQIGRLQASQDGSGIYSDLFWAVLSYLLVFLFSIIRMVWFILFTGFRIVRFPAVVVWAVLRWVLWWN